MLGGVRVLMAALLGVSVVLAAAGPVSAKPPNPCRVLLPADLDTIFEQPWGNGKGKLGGGCEFLRAEGADVPDIVVSLVVEEKSSVKQAKKVFARQEEVTRELADGVIDIPGLGAPAYYTTLIGVDVLTMRVGKNLAEIRVDRPDDTEATFREQAVAIGAIVQARLTPLPPDTKSRETTSTRP